MRPPFRSVFRWQSQRWCLLAYCAFLGLALPPQANGALRIWDGSGRLGTGWSEFDNWTLRGAPVPGDDLRFPAGAAQLANNNNYAVGTGFGSINYSGAGYTASGNLLSLSNGLSVTHGVGIRLGANQSFNVSDSSATLLLTDTIDLDSFNLTFTGAGKIQVQGGFTRRSTLFGGSPLTQDGPGTTVLTVSNDLHGGAISVKQGTLIAGHRFALGTGSFGVSVFSGATLGFIGSLTVDQTPVTLAGVLSNNAFTQLSAPVTLQGPNGLFVQREGSISTARLSALMVSAKPVRAHWS